MSMRFPGEDFSGQVRQIRLNASMTQNVVTYTVVVDVNNEKKKLLPYLTANVKFEVARPGLGAAGSQRGAQLAPAPRARLRPNIAMASEKGAMLWAREGDFVRPVSVTVVDTDGSTSAVKGDDLVEGLEVVTGEMRGVKRKGPVVNPLLPQMQGKKESRVAGRRPNRRSPDSLDLPDLVATFPTTFAIPHVKLPHGTHSPHRHPQDLRSRRGRGPRAQWRLARNPHGRPRSADRRLRAPARRP
jgi:hypothetical protein